MILLRCKPGICEKQTSKINKWNPWTEEISISTSLPKIKNIFSFLLSIKKRVLLKCYRKNFLLIEVLVWFKFFSCLEFLRRLAIQTAQKGNMKPSRLTNNWEIIINIVVTANLNVVKKYWNDLKLYEKLLILTLFWVSFSTE